MLTWKKYALLFVMVLAVNMVFSQGCSQCKLLAEQGSELDEASFGTNINYGILYLMTVPYILLIILFRKRIGNLFRALFKK